MTKLKLVDVNYTYSQGTPFRKDALRNINIEIEDNCITGLIGHTGCGKSTLVQLLNGLLFPTSGEVIFDGKNIKEKGYDLKGLRHKVGLVFQYPEYQLFEETAFADIAFGPKNMGLEKEEIEHRVIETADMLGLKRELLLKSPFDLSGGEKRRVAIAGVMAMRPDVIVFDEPTAGLDPQGRDLVLAKIKEYRDRTGALVFIVSHSMEDMAKVSDKLLVMSKGEVVAFDDTESVFLKRQMLESIGLNVPQITRVFSKLADRGLDIDPGIFTVEDGVKTLVAALKGGEAHD